MAGLAGVLHDPAALVRAAGWAMLALVPPGLLWARGDRRRIGGERVAIKPTKFALSLAVYLLTIAWMLGFAQPDRLASPLVQGAARGLVATALVEMLCITGQAARGRRSHFNLATPLDRAISALMGLTALPFVGLLLPLAWAIARAPRPGAPPLLIAGIVAGLVLTTLLATMTAPGLGRSAGSPGAARWRPRLAHGLGVHALQAIPLLALLAGAAGRAAGGPLLLLATAGYALLTLRLLGPAPKPAAATPAAAAAPKGPSPA
ncbi:hypothetical protein [Sphingomonas morindae]|uniref:Uncharacterized protein n=1 Tax=Sphingomonas morindae TaxID=1541170 RepID=A0ABY4X3I1_9SPHN|nr:hypothetical protein [Sphingomonas morindae]USI71453.1 hypothetical protein LHA26_08860 [Sphingomonas morindae]